MNKPTVRKSGLRRTLAIGALSPLLMTAALHAQTAPEPETPAPATAGDKDDDLVILDKFEVVGSRIKRVDAEPVSPVIQIRADDLKAGGFVTIGDALRAMPFNSGQALTPADSGTSFTPGVSTINLRGLGNNSTLVLINGRRAVPYAAPGFNGFQTVFDMNSLPDAAIEGIEILKDGGSALYGSDAVGGVVNVKLRRDYQGASSTVEMGNYIETDGFMTKASVVAGAATPKTSITATFDFQKQEPVYAHDLKISRNADKTSVAAKANPRYVIEGLESTGLTEAEYLAEFGATDPVTDSADYWNWGWFDNRSASGYPGWIYSGGYKSYAQPTSTPTVAGAVTGKANIPLYNYNESNGMFPEFMRYSFYTTVQHELTDHLRAFFDLSFSRVEASVASAPTPVGLGSEQGLTQGSKMIIPSYNAYNPFGVDIGSGNRRLVELGNRISEVTSDTPRVLVGLGGDLQVGPLDDWTWESAFLYTKNSVDTLNRNSVTDYGMQQALMGLTRIGDGSLVWNPATPQSDRVYFNWFGANEPAFANFLAIDNPNSASLEYTMYDFQASGTVVELPAGPLGLAFGAEHRKEDFANVKSDLNATSNIVGGSSGSSSYGSRDITSFYAEANIPVLKGLPFVDKLEFALAGRFETYSDEGFVEKVRPKIGMKYKVNDWLAFRGSYSEAFKAPDMAYLYTSSQTSFTSTKVFDPVTSTNLLQLQIVTAGNPELKPENTDVWYAGVVFEGQKSLEGLTASVDWFRFEQDGLIAQLSDFYGYAEFLQEEDAGNPIFEGKVVREAGTNQLLYIKDDYVNISTGLYQGLDFDVSYYWDTKTIGRFNVGMTATWLDRLEVDESNMVGGYLTARWNATANASWTLRDWQLGMSGVYRGKRERSIYAGSLGDEDGLYLHATIKPQYTFNAQVSYRGFRNMVVTVGVNNVFDTTPPVDPFDGMGTTSGVNNPEPAFWYVRLTRDF